MSKLLRPTPTAGTGRKSGKDTGEHTRIYCTTCGFSCQPGRDSENGQASRSQTLEDADEPAYSESINAGCPFCGSTAWRKKVRR